MLAWVVAFGRPMAHEESKKDRQTKANEALLYLFAGDPAISLLIHLCEDGLDVRLRESL